MPAVTFDPSRQVDLYFRVNRAGSKRIVFKDHTGASYSVADHTFEFVIKDLMGNNLLTAYPSVSSNEVTISVTADQTNLPVAEYYWQLNVTDISKTWLNGIAFFHSKTSTQ